MGYIENIKYFDTGRILSGSITENKAEENRMCVVMNDF